LSAAGAFQERLDERRLLLDIFGDEDQIQQFKIDRYLEKNS
jgi:hypothetical protein